MNKKIISGCLLSSLALTSLANQPEQMHTKSAVGFTSGAVTGAVIGGPVGVVIGGFVGGVAGSFSEKKSTTEADILANEAATISDAALPSQLDNIDSDNFAQYIQHGLTLDILFTTASSHIQNRDSQRLAALAEFMQQYPNITLTLDGYTDPRGQDNYNQQLAVNRVNAVRAELIGLGVDPIRIDSQAHGKTGIIDNDSDYYAFERRVSIGISRNA